MKIKKSIIAIVVATVCTSCNVGLITPDKDDNTQKPATHEVVELKLTPAEQDLIVPTNHFVLQTFKQIGGENVFCSPLSAAFVLSMLSNGAEGNTLAELQAGLGYEGVSLDAQNAFFHKLITALPYRDSATIVELANALFLDEQFPVNEDFKTVNAQAYLASIDNLQMQANPDNAAAVINAWCADKTHNCIQHIVSADDMKEAIMAVANAIYFKGYWKEKFDKDFTQDELFYGAKENKKVAFMHQYEHHPYAENGQCQYIRLPYGDGTGYSLDIVLPNQDVNFDDFVQHFTMDNLTDLDQAVRSYREVSLYLPKFKMETTMDLVPAMQTMGIHDAFSPAANFAKISEDDTYIQTFRQKAYIAVDEDGTEAAAVTVGVVGVTSVGPGETVTFKANHPFLYFIREKQTGLILFAGKMDMPG